MKKFIFISVMTLLFTVTYGQRRDLYIYNFTSSSLDFMVDTKNFASQYPRLESAYFTGVGGLPPGDNVVYQNTSITNGVCFNSPSSTPLISTWYLKMSSSATPVALTSAIAQTVYGSSQIWASVKFNLPSLTCSGHAGPHNGGVLIGTCGPGSATSVWTEDNVMEVDPITGNPTVIADILIFME